jgi:EAL domain-containing protein (putative c-di-GMP-specific phosphodiesterase class I)
VHRSVIAIELDDAETVTAGLSGAAADQLAVTVAERLGPLVARGDLLARTGRTSFAIVTSRSGEASRLAGAAVDGVAGPVALEGESAHLKASAGISDGEGDASARLEHAELAAKVAQDAGGGRAAHFHPSMVATAADLRRTVHGLRQALRAAELRLHYQPIVSLPEQRVLGVEALVRWERPGHGLVGPADFIEVAERSGLIDDLGAAVEQLACNDLIGDGLAPPGPFALNLNVSAPQLTTGSFRARIRDVIDAFAAAGIDLHLELTETAILEDPAEACKVLEELRAHGAKVVLDDFGTGFSAISWLHQLPVDAIKLDRSFVMGLPDDEPSVRIAGLVTALAGELDLALTAEGVETEAQLESLAALGCTQAQGFLFARPMPHHELIDWLAAHPGGVHPRP